MQKKSEIITVKVQNNHREKLTKKSVFQRLGQVVDNDPLEQRRKEIKQELKRQKMDSIKKQPAKRRRNRSTSSTSSSSSGSSDSSSSSSSSSSGRNKRKAKKVRKRLDEPPDERQRKKASSHRHSLKQSSASLKSTKKALRTRSRHSMSPPQSMRSRRSASLSPSRMRSSSKMTKTIPHDRNDPKERKKDLSRERYREKEREHDKRDRDHNRSSDSIRMRSPRRSPVPSRSSRDLKRKSPEKRHGSPTRLRQPLRRSSADRERERRDKERQQREIARNKEREEALARCQERQRERERIAQEKLRKERSMEREKLRMHSSDRRSRDRSHDRADSRNRFERRGSTGRVESYEYERSESYKTGHSNRHERRERIFDQEEEYSRSRQEEVEPVERDKYLNRSNVESHSFDHHHHRDQGRYSESSRMHDNWDTPKPERSGRIVERSSENRKEWDNEIPSHSSIPTRHYQEPSSSGNWSGPNKWESQYQNSPSNTQIGPNSGRNWQNSGREMKEVNKWSGGYNEESSWNNSTHQQGGSSSISHHHSMPQSQPQQQQQQQHHVYHHTPVRRGGIGRRWNEWHGNQPRFNGPKKEDFYKKNVPYNQNQTTDGNEEMKFGNQRRFGDGFMGPRAMQKFGNRGPPQTLNRPRQDLVQHPGTDQRTNVPENQQPESSPIVKVPVKSEVIEETPVATTDTPAAATNTEPKEGDDIEDNLSEISDDADEILNQEVAAKLSSELSNKPVKVEENEKSVELEEKEVDPFLQSETDVVNNDDLTLDFEEISDGELEEESKIKGLGDALGVDWTSLVAESKIDKKSSDVIKTSMKEMWNPRKILMDIGISVKMAGKEFVEEMLNRLNEPPTIKIEKPDNEDDVKQSNAGEKPFEVNPLQFPVGFAQVAIRRRLMARSRMISKPDQILPPCLSAKTDLKMRRQLFSNLPIKEISTNVQDSSAEMKQLVAEHFKKATIHTPLTV